MKALRFLLPSLLLVACAEVPDAPTEDDLQTTDSALDGEASKTDGISNSFTYYSFRQDYRKCMSPLCGGYFVSRVNRDYTQCIDGSWQQECYVAALDWQPSGLADGGPEVTHELLLRGTLEPAEYENFSGMSHFAVTEAWEASSEESASGLFTKAHEIASGLYEHKLNSVLGTTLQEIWLDDTGADEEALSDAYAQLGDSGVIIAGYRYWFWAQGWNKGRYATQFFTRVQPAPTPSCVVGGCSSQYCTDAGLGPIVSTCEWLPQYACYQDAICEVQPEGTCGWTQTAESTQCFEDLGFGG